MERESFLRRVREATSRATLPPHPEDDPGLLVPALPEVDLVEHFTRVLTATDGIVHRNDPREALAEISRRLPAGPYLCWDEVADVAAVLDAEGRERLDAEVPADAAGRHRHQSDYADAVIGVTSAEAGLAESGTIVVRSGPGRPRMASLVPEVHVALLQVGDLHRSLVHWAEHAAGSIPDAANLVFITGPSRTGDIEQQLNLGVHGPRELHVVLI
ncbi:MAG TPA: lactate utilization protein [Acidimicrobiia bacterium]|nr:lactate utilization protein [Acidimicrobiia bacterium]